jgi:hypothetical protein
MPGLVRSLAILATGAALALMCANHDVGGMKGSYIPTSEVTSCILMAAGAALLCKWLWRRSMAPILGGIAGATICGPYGGVVGMLVGLLVALMPVAERSRTKQSV